MKDKALATQILSWVAGDRGAVTRWAGWRAQAPAGVLQGCCLQVCLWVADPRASRESVHSLGGLAAQRRPSVVRLAQVHVRPTSPQPGSPGQPHAPRGEEGASGMWGLPPRPVPSGSEFVPGNSALADLRTPFLLSLPLSSCLAVHLSSLTLPTRPWVPSPQAAPCTRGWDWTLPCASSLLPVVFLCLALAARSSGTRVRGNSFPPAPAHRQCPELRRLPPLGRRRRPGHKLSLASRAPGTQAHGAPSGPTLCHAQGHRRRVHRPCNGFAWRVCLSSETLSVAEFSGWRLWRTRFASSCRVPEAAKSPASLGSL